MTMVTKIGDTFFKQVQEKHFMKVVGGYGFQYDAFIQFEKKGIKEIHINEENGSVWSSRPSQWLEHGKIADYGRGKQIFLSLKYMSLVDMKKIDEKRQQDEIKRSLINQQRMI